MKVKVCGMRRVEDLQSLAKFPVDFVGFILYPKSKRFTGNDLSELADIQIGNAKRVGVFVNEKEERVLELASRFAFEFVQLHGEESPDYCETISKKTNVIKAFNIDESFDFQSLTKYEATCEYFLFDAKGKLPGGNSISFNWKLLEKYQFNKPFFLSGGIGPQHLNEILKINHPSFFAVDINSGFEYNPGEKNVDSIKKFLTAIKAIT